MTSKYILCFAVLIAAIEAFPQPQYVAIPIAEYEALISLLPEPQSHSLQLAASSTLSRHKRSNDQFIPIAPPSEQQYRRYRTQEYAPRQAYDNYESQRFAASAINEEAVKPERLHVARRPNGGYKQQQQYRPSTQQFVDASKINEVMVEPEYRPRPALRQQQQQYRPRPQQFVDASKINEVMVEPEHRPRPALRPFTGGYDGTPQYSPSQIVYVEEDPSVEFISADLEQASSNHENRDAGYGGGHGGGGDDHVDYGAYTGSHGAFGWYSDHPVLVYRK